MTGKHHSLGGAHSVTSGHRLGGQRHQGRSRRPGSRDGKRQHRSERCIWAVPAGSSSDSHRRRQGHRAAPSRGRRGSHRHEAARHPLPWWDSTLFRAGTRSTRPCEHRTCLPFSPAGNTPRTQRNRGVTLLCAQSALVNVRLVPRHTDDRETAAPGGEQGQSPGRVPGGFLAPWPGHAHPAVPRARPLRTKPQHWDSAGPDSRLGRLTPPEFAGEGPP